MNKLLHEQYQTFISVRSILHIYSCLFGRGGDGLKCLFTALGKKLFLSLFVRVRIVLSLPEGRVVNM